MRRLHTPHRDDRGVVAIEFVFILPFLLMLLMGILVLGNYLSVKGQASNLARNGARTAALFPGTALGDSRLSIVGSPCPTIRDSTKSVTVRATLNVGLKSIPLIPVVLPSTLFQEVTMRCGG
ncbi:MAG: TadE-like protein [Ilumatobacteraceae bacterium]